MAGDLAFVAPSVVGSRPFVSSELQAASAKSQIMPVTTSPNARRVGPTMAFSSINHILTPPPVAVPQDSKLVVRAVYTQVFGNAHMMDSELAELATAESTFLLNLDIREFVRAIAHSELYKELHFHSVSQYRATELAFKHFLGRAPGSLEEYASAMAAYTEGGYEAFVNWFVDSDEYQESFGPQIVPYGVYEGCYSSNELFNRSVAMRYSAGCSDKGRSPMLAGCVCSNTSPNWLSIAKGLPAGTEKGTGLCIGGHWFGTQRNKNAPVKVPTKIPGGVVFY